MNPVARLGEHRWAGDKATLQFFDLHDPGVDAVHIAELVRTCRLSTFAPDTVAEARNRGYSLRLP